MALIEGCKHELEIAIPLADIEAEKQKMAEKLRGKLNLPGFRPGKAPISMIRQRYEASIVKDAIDNLLPKFFRKRVEEEEHLQWVGQPTITPLEVEPGEPIRFKAEFEVAPEVELGQYRDVTVTYSDPSVSDADVDERLEGLRLRKADYINLDPRPAESGDIAVVDMHSVKGVEGEPMHAHDMQVDLGSAETMPELSDQIIGMTPGEEKNITVTYPEEYGQERLAGKTVEFHVELKQLQKKELPELNDDFAKDLGDFQTLDELKDAIRKNILQERGVTAQRAAKDAIVDKLADAHDFPVPEAYVDRQVELYIQQFMASQTERGLDPKKIPIDPARVKEAMRDRAVKQVRTSLLLDKIAERESIHATKDEMDSEVQRYAKQEREPVAAVRKRFEENGTIGRIANAIRTEKTLNFLFEHARKEAPAEKAPTEEAASE